MAAHACEGDEDPVARCQEGAGPHQQIALRRTRVVVHGEHHVAGKALEQAIGHHGLGATVEAALFRRLKDQVQRAAEPARGRQVPRCTQQHGGVAVVTAGVHAAGHGARIGQARLLLDRQRVHVCSQAQAPVARSHAQLRHQPRLADAARDLVAPLRQLARHHVGGLVLRKGQLGVAVDVAAPAGQFVVLRSQILDPRGPGSLHLVHQLESISILLSLATRW